MFPASAFARRPSRFHVATKALKGAAAATSSGVLQQPMVGATDDASTSNRAIFLKNDGEWICTSSSSASSSSASSKVEVLEALSVRELRQQARQVGQKSTGSKKELVQRLINQEPPVPTRPRRRKHGKLAETPPGYVERQATTRPRPLHPYTPQLRVLSWNVNGIRAQMEKEEGRNALKAIVAEERPHVLGLQEIRISAPAADTPSAPKKRKNATSPSPNFTDIVKSILPDYDTIWLSSFPPARQGYSGTALFVRKRRGWDTGCPKLLNVRGGIGHPQGDLEGRVTTAELDVAFVVNVYTPNAGAGLKRLDFRTKEWDKAFAEYVRGLEKTKPVVVVGDFNVARLDIDFYNPEQKRMRKAAGTTPEERSSFAINLLGCDPPPSCVSTSTASTTTTSTTSSNGKSKSSKAIGAAAMSGRGQEGALDDAVKDEPTSDGGFLVDTFRELHPTARGVFSYWSVRAGNRPVNRGMRLDYCLASRALVNGEAGNLHDAFVLDRATVGVSDHAPVGVVLRLGEHYPE
eukprot:g12602.t1